VPEEPRVEDPKIPAYFSHSYRPADREVNLFFFEEMWKRGFTFTVDPKSSSLSTTHLEIMMRDNACFVGVVTRRDEERFYRCSPFAVYEFGLSLLEPKPRIMFLEKGVPAHHFLNEPRLYQFDRETLSQFRFNEGAIAELREEAEAFSKGAPVRREGIVGLALPPSKAYAEVRPRMEELLQDAGYATVELKPGMESYEAARELARLDFLLIDIVNEGPAPWLFPFSQGMATPSIKLVYHQPGIDEAPTLPTLAGVKALASTPGAHKMVLWWRDADELFTELERRIARLHVRRREFTQHKDGQRYFMSLGRAQGPVFISNAQNDNTLALDVVRLMDLYNIEHFHYLYRNTIPLGTSWEARLLAKVRECRIFVPLISEAYWESDWCRRELQAARELQQQGRLTILSGLLEDTRVGEPISDQGIWLGSESATAQAKRIVDAVDRQLAKEADIQQRPRARTTDPHLADPDFLVVATTGAQYFALKGLLDNPSEMMGTPRQPNDWGWMAGTINVPDRGRYRVLLAHTNNNAVAIRAATHTAVEVFTPEHVVICSTAGAVGPYLAQGSAFIPDRVYGFVLDLPYRTLVPRPDWDFPIPPVPWEVLPTLDCAGTEPDKGQIGGGALICGDDGGGLHHDAHLEIPDYWPDALAVNYSLISTIELLDDLHQRGRIAHFTVVCGIADSTRDHAAEAVTNVTETVQRLLGTGWLRPPRADAPPRADG